jgi:hypothetical protein
VASHHRYGLQRHLQLPDNLRPSVNPRYITETEWQLAGGQIIDEDIYRVDFPFDGEMVSAEATFGPGSTILIGTHLLRQYRLTIDFVNRTVLLERKV